VEVIELRRVCESACLTTIASSAGSRELAPTVSGRPRGNHTCSAWTARPQEAPPAGCVLGRFRKNAAWLGNSDRPPDQVSGWIRTRWSSMVPDRTVNSQVFPKPKAAWRCRMPDNRLTRRVHRQPAQWIQN